MHASYRLVYLSFSGLLYFQQVAAVDISKAKSFTALGPPKTNSLKQPLDPLTWIHHPAIPTKRVAPTPRVFPKAGKIQRRDIPFQDSILEPPIKTDNEKIPDTDGSSTNQETPAVLNVPGIKSIVKPNETEAERAERIHKSFERLLTFVEIVGQVDNYVSSKWKNLVRTVSNFYEVEDEPYRLNAKRIYGSCPSSL